MPKHKKNPEVGDKKTVYSSQIFVEQEDALSFEDQEEVTLMDWGNAIVRSKTTDASGVVTAIEMDLHLEGDFRKTKKKITWLAQPGVGGAPALIDVTLLDYDYLITKKKLEENDDVKDFVTPVSEFRDDARADANVAALTKGDIIQFERKGYYIFDGVVAGRHEFIHIPDGRAASIASKAGAQTGTATPAEGAKKDAKAASKKGASNDTPVETKMYKVAKVYGEDDVIPTVETKMYQVQSIYQS